MLVLRTRLLLDFLGAIGDGGWAGVGTVATVLNNFAAGIANESIAAGLDIKFVVSAGHGIDAVSAYPTILPGVVVEDGGVNLGDGGILRLAYFHSIESDPLAVSLFVGVDLAVVVGPGQVAAVLGDSILVVHESEVPGELEMKIRKGTFGFAVGG